MTKALTFSRNTQSNRQPVRKIREIGEPCAERTSPPFFSVFFFPCLATATNNSKEPLIKSRDGSGRSSNQSKSIDCPKRESRLRGGVRGGEKVSSSLWSESDMNYGLTSPLLHEYWLRLSLPCLTVQEEDRLLHSGAEAHIDEEGAQGCCCWWRWRHSACSNERCSPTLTHCKKKIKIPTSSCTIGCRLYLGICHKPQNTGSCKSHNATLHWTLPECKSPCLSNYTCQICNADFLKITLMTSPELFRMTIKSSLQPNVTLCAAY